MGWRWIFLVNIPIGIAAFLFSLKFLAEYKTREAGEFDLAGFLLSTVGLVLVFYALSIVPTRGFQSLQVIASGSIGIALLLILVWVEFRKPNPILHFSLFRDRLFRTTNVIMFFAFALWLGFLFVLPLFLQQLGGLSAFQSGLILSPQALGWVTMSTVASRLYQRLGPRSMITFGLLGATIMTAVFVLIDPHMDLGIISLILFLRGMSMAFAVIPIQAATFTNISAEETGRASSIFNTNRQVASSFGVALLGMVLFEMLQTHAPAAANQLYAFHIAFAAAGVLGLISILFATTIRNQDAAASLAETSKSRSAFERSKDYGT